MGKASRSKGRWNEGFAPHTFTIFVPLKELEALKSLFHYGSNKKVTSLGLTRECYGYCYFGQDQTANLMQYEGYSDEWQMNWRLALTQFVEP